MRNSTAAAIRLGWSLAGMMLIAAWINMAAIAPAQAATQCQNEWCSGADSNTATNIQGKAPQVHGGEVGYYGAAPCPNLPYGDCFSTTGASGANQRAVANTGLGTFFYYYWGS